MSALLVGAACGRCGATEQRCAYIGGCCPLCTHWSEIEAAPTGERSTVSGLPQLQDVAAHGTEDGYWQHRLNRSLPCGPCATAHLRYKGLVA